MKENNNVTNFKEIENEAMADMEFENEEEAIENDWTWKDSLHMFKLKHGDKIKKAAITVGTVAAVAAGYLIVSALRDMTSEDSEALGEIEGNIFDSAGETVGDTIDSSLDGVDATDF